MYRAERCLGATLGLSYVGDDWSGLGEQMEKISIMFKTMEEVWQRREVRDVWAHEMEWNKSHYV